MQALAEEILSGYLTVAELIERQEELSKVNLVVERFSHPDCNSAKLTKCLLNLSRLVGEQHLKTHTNKPVISLKRYDNLDSWIRHLSELTNK